MFCVVTEDTERVISERRLGLVRELSSRLALAQTTPDVARAVEEASPVASRDLPFTLMYLFEKDEWRATRVTHTGIAADHPAAADEIDVRESSIWLIEEALHRDEPLVLESLPAGPRWPSGPWNPQGGLRLGLTIVRSLVELHGGNVEVRSEGQGKGAEFSVRLPRVPAAVAAEAQREPTEVIVSDRKTAHPRRVLVVDDNADAAAMLADALTSYGHTVRTAHDGPAALREAQEFRPELAFLDIGLARLAVKAPSLKSFSR